MMPRHRKPGTTERIPGDRAEPLAVAASGDRRRPEPVAGTPLASGFRERPPRSCLACVERGNPVGVRALGSGRPIARGAESLGGTGCPRSECRWPKGSGTRDKWPLLQAVVTGNRPDAGLATGPGRALTWAGEPLNNEAGMTWRTEGQVGHHQGERTRGRLRLGRRCLACP